MFLKSIYYKLIDHKWLLGFPQNDLKNILEGEQLEVKWVKGMPEDRWFADPFILSVSETAIVLLVEEYVYSIKKGRIAKLTIDRTNYTLLKNELVLELDTHLSFPAIIREGNQIYIYPENSDANNLCLYRYNVEDNSCIFVDKLSDEPLADAICTSAFGDKQLLSTVVPHQNGDTLGVFLFDDNCKRYKWQYDVSFEENIARNAGDIFQVDNLYYRAAQICNHGYGEGLSFQRLSVDDNKKIKLEEVVRMYSPNSRFEIGMHTFNTYAGVSVIDVKGYKHPIVGRLVSKLKSLIYFYAR